MKKTVKILVCLIVVTLLLNIPLANAEPTSGHSGEYMPGELLVKFVDKASPAATQNARQGVGAQHLKTFSALGVQHWRLGQGLSVEQALDILSKPAFQDAIEYAEPNYIVHAFAFPNDPMRNELWGMHNLGQTGGTNDADIDALEAWEVQTGSSNVVVGVIDTGIDYNHEDLATNIWINPGEDINNNGIVDESDFNGVDDDDNGYIDDIRGWDFRNDDNDPMDDNGHGTHCAGTIGAMSDNGIGVTGVSWNVQLMPLKFLCDCGTGTIADAIEAVNYATSFEDELGNKIVRITSNSYGGSHKSKAEEIAIKNSGALFVAAAGNSGRDRKEYPAGYNLDNIISVAATDHNDELASFSNYGSDWVDLGAPGVDILSTILEDSYDTKDGTSMSTPHVAGVAALLMAQNPTWTNAQLKAAILDNVDPLPSLAGKTLTGGRLNARAAVGAPEFPEDSTAPSAVTDLAVGGVTVDTITLTWSATGDDGDTGTAYLYDVRYLDVPIDDTNWDSATQVQGEPIPQSFGSPETFTVTGLSPGTTYYFALKVADEAGNYADISNVAGGTTEESLWNIEIVDSGKYVGGFSALAYDSSGNPSIGYSDFANYNVQFAHWNGETWDIEIVDHLGEVDYIRVDLAYDPTDGNPSLSYAYGGLKFAHWNGASWDIEVIEGRSVKVQMISLAYDPIDKNPSISYAGGKGKASGLKFTSFNLDTNSWETEVVERGARAIYSSLAYDAAGNPSIAYSDDIDPDIGGDDAVKFAHWNGANWDIEIVETSDVHYMFYGHHISLAYDPTTGFPSITHAWKGVRFLSWNGNSWDLEIVDYGKYRSGSSLVYTSDGTAFISYTSEMSGEPSQVKLAHRNGPNNWQWEVVDRPGSGQTSLKFDPNGNPSLSYCEYGSDINKLKFARKG